MNESQNKITLPKLIAKLCPDGVEYKTLWSLTTWDKKFNAVDRAKQPKTISYPYFLANELFALQQDEGDVFLLSTGEKTGWTTEECAGKNLCEGEVVTIPWGKSRNVTDVMKYYKGKFVTADNRIATSNDTEILSNKFLFYWMQSQGDVIDSFYRGSGIQHPSMKHVLDMRIPLPPIEVQREIVRILDKFTELISLLETERIMRVKQYEYYREKLLTFSDDVPRVNICEIFEIRNGYTPSKAKSEFWENGSIPWFVMEDIRKNGRVLSDSIQHITPEAVKGNGLFKANSIIMATSATIGEHALITVDHLSNQRFINLKVRDAYSDLVDIKFLFYYAFVIDEWCKKNTSLSSFATVDMSGFKKLEIPLPPLSEQKRIADMLDRFDALCNDTATGIPAEIAARKKQYEYYRDRLLTFREKTAANV